MFKFFGGGHPIVMGCDYQKVNNGLQNHGVPFLSHELLDLDEGGARRTSYRGAFFSEERPLVHVV